MNLKNYKTIICTAAAVAFLGAAVFCGFQIYSHYQQIDEQTEAFAEIAEVVENAEVKGKIADPDRAACLPPCVHPLWLNAVRLKIEHGVDVLPCFPRNPHHIEKRPVVAVVDLAFHHAFQKKITVGCVAKPYL